MGAVSSGRGSGGGGSFALKLPRRLKWRHSPRVAGNFCRATSASMLLRH